MQGHSDCFLLGRRCWLVAHLPLNWFDSLEQQNCLHFLPGSFSALRKFMENSAEQHKSWQNQGNRDHAAGKSKLLRQFTTCHETASTMVLVAEHGEEQVFSSLIWLICLFQLGVDIANGLPLNFVIFCFVVDMCLYIEGKELLFGVAFTLYRHGEVDFFFL